LLIKLLLLISIFLNLYFIYKLVSAKKGIGYFSAVLKGISRGDFNRRIHMGLSYQVLKELGSELNVLMDRFQTMLEEKQKLEISHKQLIANISHDIRTPLTSLLGYIEVLQETTGISQEERERYLSVIQSKGQYLYRMIQEFFELSKLEADDTIIKAEKNDIVEIIKEVLASFYQDFMTNGVTPTINLPEEPVYVFGDGTSIERILGNLISNSIKYGVDGGIVGVTLRKEKSKVWVDIWDKGQGIPDNEIKFIFDRLYTAEASRNEKLRGSGLGLAIARQLVEKQKGEIVVSSIPGQKTIFSFCLPSF